MARRRRETSSFANGRPLLPLIVSAPRPLAVTRPRFLSPLGRRALVEIEDRRTFFPGRLGHRPARTLFGTLNSSLKVSSRGRSLSPWLSFGRPQSIAICVRRKQRREAIFAVGKAGRGVKRRRPRRNRFSSISCRG